MKPRISLDLAPLHQPVTLLSADVESAVARRLTALGLRRGVQMSLVQRLSGGGRVVSVAGARVALARQVLAAMTVEAA